MADNINTKNNKCEGTKTTTLNTEYNINRLYPNNMLKNMGKELGLAENFQHIPIMEMKRLLESNLNFSQSEDDYLKNCGLVAYCDVGAQTIFKKATPHLKLVNTCWRYFFKQPQDGWLRMAFLNFKKTVKSSAKLLVLINKEENELKMILVGNNLLNTILLTCTKERLVSRIGLTTFEFKSYPSVFGIEPQGLFFSDDADKLIGRFGDLLQQDNIDLFKNMFTTFTEAISNRGEEASNVLNSIRELGSEFSDAVMKKMSLLFAVVALFINYKDSNFILVSGALGLVAYTHRNDIKELYSKINSYDKIKSLMFGKAEAQSGLTEHSSDIASAISLFLVGKNCSGKSRVAMTDIFRTFSSAKIMTQSVVSLVIKLVEVILYSTGNGRYYEKLYMIINPADPTYTEFSEKVFDIDDKFVNRKLTYTNDNYEMLKATLVEGERLLRDLPNNSATRGLHSTMNSAVQRIRSYKKNFMDSGFMMEGLRQEPVAILLRGGPGTLKTQTMQHLSHALASATVEPEYREAFKINPESFIYNRQVETEYWDGYDHHRIVANFDDLLQIRDVAGGGDSEVFNIIRAVNENAYDLHMASLDHKGSTKFRCKFVVATTNSAHLNVQSIHDKNALLRRFHRTYTVYPKSEFAKKNVRAGDMTQAIDMNTLPIGELDITSTNPDEVLEFREYNLITGEHTGRVLQFTDIVNEALDRYKFNKLCYDQKVLELAKRREQWANAIYSQGAFDFFKNKVESVKEYLFPEQYTDAKDFFDNSVVANNWFGELVHSCEEPEFQFIDKVFQAYSEKDKMRLINRLVVSTDLQRDFSVSIKDHVVIKYALKQTWFRNQLLNTSVDPNSMRDRLILDEGIKELIPAYDFEIIESVKPTNSILKSIKELRSSVTGDSEYSEWLSWKNVFTIAGTVIGVAGFVFAYKENKDAKDLRKLISIADQLEGDYKHKPKKTIKRADRKTARQLRAEQQISLVVDQQGEDLIRAALRTNFYEFSIKSDDSPDFKKCGYVTFLFGNVGILPHHFCDIIKASVEDRPERLETTDIRLRGAFNSKSGNHELHFTIDDILKNCYDTPSLEKQDLILVAFPNMPPRSNIMKLLYTDQDVEKLDKIPNCVLASTGSEVVMTHVRGHVLSERVQVESEEFEEYTINKVVSYTAPTRKGDCGTLLCILDPTQRSRKICGIHVAGTPMRNQGYSAIFTYEQIQECLEEIPKSFKIDCQMDFYDAQPREALVGDGRFGQVKDVPRGPALPITTKIIKSHLYNKVVESFMAPAKLKPGYYQGERISPWDVALKNYNMEVPVFKQNIVERSVQQYKDYLFSNSSKDVDRKVLTFEESVIGLPGTEFDSINRGTSCGFPYVLETPASSPGKTAFFGHSDEFEFSSDFCIKLRDEVHECIMNAKEGIRSEHIFMDSLKDELRPLDKVSEFKTRLISGSPIKLLILYRMYFGSYMLWYKINRINNQSMIGVNVYSDEWNYAAKRLMEFSPGKAKNVGAGDYSKFDGSEKPYIHNKILEIINEWYGDDEEDNLIREVLWLELTNSKHIQNKCVYEWYTSLPSGHPMTPVVNTMYNGIAFRYCWNRAFEDDLRVRDKFHENCFLLALGDDNVFSVRSQFRNKFTEVIVGKFMAELGLTYTSEVKDAVNVEMRHLEDVEFLKRKWKFSKDANRYVAPLRLNRLLETLNWTKTGGRADVIVRDNVVGILRELSLHGRDTFEVYKKKIVKASVEHLEFYPPSTSYFTNFKEVCELEAFC